MLKCTKCQKPYDLEDYQDPNDMDAELCPMCKFAIEIDNDTPEDRFENDAVSVLEDELDPGEMEDILSGPDDDEIDEYEDEDEEAPWDEDDYDDDDYGDADRDDF